MESTQEQFISILDTTWQVTHTELTKWQTPKSVYVE